MFIIIISALLFICAWDNGKKRTIGLTFTSLITIFLSPFIGSIVSLCFKRIVPDKKQKPTLEQRLPYERVSLMYFCAILFFLTAVICFFIGYENLDSESNANLFLKMAFFALSYIIWGAGLIDDAKALKKCEKQIRAQQDNKTEPQPEQPTSPTPGPFNEFLTLLTTDQYKVVNTVVSDKIKANRSVIISTDATGQYYTIKIIDTDTNDINLNSAT